jgi:L-asparagine transporter-like permease
MDEAISGKMQRNDQMKLEEYRSLREEHMKNRNYMFERPIIILGLVAVALQFSYQHSFNYFILAVIIFILCFNLWFISNRLNSDSRIVAYIQLFHEGELKEKWIGWESALRQYREWRVENPKAISKVSRKIKARGTPRSFQFYPAIWIFHLVLVVLTFSLSLMGLKTSRNIIDIIGVLVVFITVIIFFVYAFKLHPNKFGDSIELERRLWEQVFDN